MIVENEGNFLIMNPRAKFIPLIKYQLKLKGVRKRKLFILSLGVIDSFQMGRHLRIYCYKPKDDLPTSIFLGPVAGC